MEDIFDYIQKVNKAPVFNLYTYFQLNVTDTQIYLYTCSTKKGSFS